MANHYQRQHFGESIGSDATTTNLEATRRQNTRNDESAKLPEATQGQKYQKLYDDKILKAARWHLTKSNAATDLLKVTVFYDQSLPPHKTSVMMKAVNVAQR